MAVVGNIVRIFAIVFVLATASGSAQVAGTAKPSGQAKARSKVAHLAADENVRKALTLEQQARYPEAQAAWETVVKSQPKNAQAFAHLGLLQARQEHYVEAIVSYSKAQALNPEIPQLNLNLGLALFKAGNFTEAAKVFQAELNKASTQGNAQVVQRLTILEGMSHYAAHEYAAAIPFLKQAAAADPGNLPLRLNLAHCYLWTKQLDPIMGVYQEMLAIDPDSAEADMIAGEALDEKGDNAGAVQQFRAAVKANPREPNVHFGLAYLLLAQKKFEEAIPEFKAELENDPKNYQAMIYLGDAYMQQSQYELAREVLERALPFQDRVPLVHLDLGIVYMESGSAEAAVRELSRAVELDPENVTAHFRLARVYQSLGKREEAKAEFAKSSSLNRKAEEGLHQRIAEANARGEPDAKPANPDKP